MKFDRVVLIEICFKCICSVLSYENSQKFRFRLHHQVTRYTLKHPELKFYQYNYKAQTILSSEIATSHSIEIHNNHSTIQVTYYSNSVLPLSGKMLPINSAQDLQSARQIIYLSRQVTSRGLGPNLIATRRFQVHYLTPQLTPYFKGRDSIRAKLLIA